MLSCWFWRSSLFLSSVFTFGLSQGVLFNISCRAHLVVMSSSSICLGNSFSFFQPCWIEYSLGCTFSLFSMLNISCHFRLTYQISVEKFSATLFVFSCKLGTSFIFLLLEFFPYLYFEHFTDMSWCWTAFVDFDGRSLFLLDLEVYFLPQIRQFF